MSAMSVAEVRQYISRQSFEVMGEYNRDFNRTLQYTIGGDLYEVFDHGKVVHKGSNTQAALDAYDAIPPQ